jgi:hypothetical protein
MEVSLLLHVFFNAVLLWLSVHLAGGSGRRRNTLLRAFGASAALSALTALAAWVSDPNYGLAMVVWTLGCLALLRWFYDVGWIRAILLTMVSFVLSSIAYWFVYVPLFLAGVGFSTMWAAP